MIGSVCPHSVIFPSIVGKNNAAYPEFVRSTYNLLVSSFDAELVAQTEFFIREIKRITILWEEEWLHTVNQLTTWRELRENYEILFGNEKTCC